MPVKPSEKEEQFFREQELKARLHKLAQEQEVMAVDEKRDLKELHWMHCPKCGQQLAMEQYDKVEVDVCPGCKGVWLDATELETIVASTSRGSAFRSFLKILGA